MIETMNSTIDLAVTKNTELRQSEKKEGAKTTPGVQRRSQMSTKHTGHVTAALFNESYSERRKHHE
jgi:hypothetical protein